jgi:hypothetical protein
MSAIGGFSECVELAIWNGPVALRQTLTSSVELCLGHWVIRIFVLVSDSSDKSDIEIRTLDLHRVFIPYLAAGCKAVQVEFA